MTPNDLYPSIRGTLRDMFRLRRESDSTSVQLVAVAVAGGLLRLVDQTGAALAPIEVSSSRIANGFEEMTGVAAPALSPVGSGRMHFDSGLLQYMISESGGAYVPLNGALVSGWTDDGPVVRLTTPTDQVSIGQTVPPAGSKLFDATEAAEVVFHSRVAHAAQAAEWWSDRARGTLAAPALVASGDVLGRWLSRGWDGAAYQPAAQIEVAADAGTGAGDMPGRIVFSTTADGAAVLTERMRITQGGRVLIGTTVAVGGGTLQVAGGARIAGKLTVTGVIDPTAVELSPDPDLPPTTTMYFSSTDGQTAPASAANTGRLRYNDATKRWESSQDTSVYAPFGTVETGWTRTAATPVVALTTVTDPVALGTATPVAGVKLLVVDDGGRRGMRLTGAAAAVLVDCRRTADTGTRIALDADGTITWTDGAGAGVGTLVRTGTELGTSALHWTADVGIGIAPNGVTRLRVNGGAAYTDALQVIGATASNTIHAVPNLTTQRALTINAAGDANPRFTLMGNGELGWWAVPGAQDCTLSRASAGVLVTSDGTSFGVGSGGASTASFRMGGTIVLQSTRRFAIDWLPQTDNTFTVGSATFRASAVDAVQFRAFAAAGAANPAHALGATNGFAGGAGGGAALDTRIYRTAANTLTLDDFAGGAATLIPGADGVGNIGTGAARFGLVRAVTITAGDLGFDEMSCACCGQDFAEGDTLQLRVVKIDPGDGRPQTRTIPVHATCRPPHPSPSP